jgi:hypothetical protein
VGYFESAVSAELVDPLMIREQRWIFLARGRFQLPTNIPKSCSPISEYFEHLKLFQKIKKKFWPL